MQKFAQASTLKNFAPTILRTLTDAERDLQDSLLTQQKELHENTTAHFDYTKISSGPTIIHTYTAKLAKKNTALVQYRTKQTELRHLHANESVLTAFQNAETQVFSIIQKAVAPHHCISLKLPTPRTSRVSAVSSVSCMRDSINDHS